jgi:hypothetical protein
MAFAAAMSSRKSSRFQVESLGYSTVMEYVVSYLQLREPGGRGIRLTLVQTGSLPKAMQSSLSVFSCRSNLEQSIRNRTRYLPGDVEMTALSVRSAAEARSEAKRVSQSVSKSRYRCRTLALHPSVHLRPLERS